jgi:hypothetical protein
MRLIDVPNVSAGAVAAVVCRSLVAVALLLGLLLAAPQPLRAEARIGFGANDVDFLNLVGQIEAPQGFGAVSGFAPALPERPLVEMTLDEVLAYQREIRALGTLSSAMGRYQFIYPTLSRLRSELGIAGDLRFDPEVQTYLARFLMHDCGFYDADRDLEALANCLARVWAALPVVSGPQRGRSFYAGDGINRALTTPEMVLTVLEQRFDW